MKIVIDISEDDYCAIRNGESLYAIGHDYYDNVVTNAFKSATVLPEGHGRLVDGDLLDSKMYHAAFETDTNFQKWDSGCWIRYKLYENIRNEIPVVLTADKGH